MKKTVLLFIFFLCFKQIYGRSFSELNPFLWGTYTKAYLTQLLNEEKAIYKDKVSHTTLLNIYYIESFVADLEKDNSKKLQKLLWVIENSRKSDYLIYAHANYHLGSLLNYLNSNEIAKYYAYASVKSAKKHKIKALIKFTYALVAAVHYNLAEFDKATNFYNLAFMSEKEYDYLFKASMLNNISLCKMKIGDLASSNAYIFRSLFYLDKIKNKAKDVELFKVIVEGNLGSNYHTMKELEKAKHYLENEVNYYMAEKVELNNAFKPFQELIEIQTFQKNKLGVEKLIEDIKEIERHLINKNDRFNYSQLLYNFYHPKNDLKHIKEYSDKIIKAKAFVADSIQKNSNQLNNILYSQEIRLQK